MKYNINRVRFQSGNTKPPTPQGYDPREATIYQGLIADGYTPAEAEDMITLSYNDTDIQTDELGMLYDTERVNFADRAHYPTIEGIADRNPDYSWYAYEGKLKNRKKPLAPKGDQVKSFQKDFLELQKALKDDPEGLMSYFIASKYASPDGIEDNSEYAYENPKNNKMLNDILNFNLINGVDGIYGSSTSDAHKKFGNILHDYKLFKSIEEGNLDDGVQSLNQQEGHSIVTNPDGTYTQTGNWENTSPSNNTTNTTTDPNANNTNTNNTGTIADPTGNGYQYGSEYYTDGQWRNNWDPNSNVRYSTQPTGLPGWGRAIAVNNAQFGGGNPQQGYMMSGYNPMSMRDLRRMQRQERRNFRGNRPGFFQQIGNAFRGNRPQGQMYYSNAGAPMQTDAVNNTYFQGSMPGDEYYGVTPQQAPVNAPVYRNGRISQNYIDDRNARLSPYQEVLDGSRQLRRDSRYGMRTNDMERNLSGRAHRVGNKAALLSHREGKDRDLQNARIQRRDDNMANRFYRKTDDANTNYDVRTNTNQALNEAENTYNVSRNNLNAARNNRRAVRNDRWLRGQRMNTGAQMTGPYGPVKQLNDDASILQDRADRINSKYGRNRKSGNNAPQVIVDPNQFSGTPNRRINVAPSLSAKQGFFMEGGNMRPKYQDSGMYLPDNYFKSTYGSKLDGRAGLAMPEEKDFKNGLYQLPKYNIKTSMSDKDMHAAQYKRRFQSDDPMYNRIMGEQRGNSLKNALNDDPMGLQDKYLQGRRVSTGDFNTDGDDYYGAGTYEQYGPLDTRAQKKALGFGNDGLTKGDKMQIFGNYLPSLYNLGHAFIKPYPTMPAYNKYRYQVYNDMNKQKAARNYNPIYAMMNKGMRDLRNGVPNEQVERANKLALWNTAMDTMGKAQISDDERDRQFNSQAIQQLGQIGEHELQANERARLERIQHEEARDNIVSKGVGQFGAATNKYGEALNNSLDNKMKWELLSGIYEKYGLSNYNELLSGLQAGTYTLDDIVNFKKDGDIEKARAASLARKAAKESVQNTEVKESDTNGGMSGTETTVYN